MAKRLVDGKGGRSRFADGHAGALAIREQALSIYWEWCIGESNYSAGTSSVVSIDGPLEKKSSWYDGYDAIVDRFKAACADPDTTSVILKFDSPGGACSGLFDAVVAMRAIAAKSRKRIVAVADDCAFSAAYALACVASEIYLGRASFAGSVGVLCVVGDCVGYNEQHGINIVVVHAGEKKIYGHPDVPLSDDAIASFQSEVDQLASMFFEVVSASRGMTTEDVAALQAGTFMGEEAVTSGLADGVMTFDQVVAMLAADAKQPSAEVAGDNGEENMRNGQKPGHKTAAESNATDAFATAVVAPVNTAAMTAIAGALGAGQPHVAESSDEEEETAKDEEETYEGSASEEEEEEESAAAGDDEEEEEEEEEEEASAPIPQISASANSADVLKAVREITGQTGASAQLGGLYALRSKAEKADAVIAKAKKAAAAARKSALATMVDKAISAGQLSPAQKKWALSCSVEGLKAFLKDAPSSLVKRAPTAGGTPLKARPASKNKTAMDQALVAVAKATGQDVKTLQAHAEELKTKGVIH